jgi:YhcH/YjgK/YiaL family protein
MILDELTAAKKYDGLFSAFAKAFEYLRSTDFHSMKDGRYPIDGDSIYASVTSYSTENPLKRFLETHRRNIDIHFLLAGRETIFYAPLEQLQPRSEYDPEKDNMFMNDPPDPSAGSAVLRLGIGHFAVFFPWDAHKPGCCSDPEDPPVLVRKVVIKVLM